MTRLYVMLSNFRKNESGATAIEYGLLAAGLAVIIGAAITTLGGELNTLFTGLFDNATATTAPGGEG